MVSIFMTKSANPAFCVNFVDFCARFFQKLNFCNYSFSIGKSSKCRFTFDENTRTNWHPTINWRYAPTTPKYGTFQMGRCLRCKKCPACEPDGCPKQTSCSWLWIIHYWEAMKVTQFIVFCEGCRFSFQIFAHRCLKHDVLSNPLKIFLGKA